MHKKISGAALKRQITHSAAKRHLKGAKRNAYVYGTLHKVGYRYHKKTGR